jgi:hypothetical protein
MMKPRFPELRIGTAIRRNHMTIYPLFPAQRLLFSDAFPGPAFAVATYRQRAKVRTNGERQTNRTIPAITNTSKARTLFLPSDHLDNFRVLTTAILIPAGATVRVPSLCCGPAHGGGGNRIVLGAHAVGWIVVGIDQWKMHLFGHANAAQQAARRRWSICASHGSLPGRSEIEAFAAMIHHLPWKHVRSASPRGTDFVAQAKSIQAGALFVGRNLIHLFSVKTF